MNMLAHNHLSVALVTEDGECVCVSAHSVTGFLYSNVF